LPPDLPFDGPAFAPAFAELPGLALDELLAAGFLAACIFPERRSLFNLQHFVSRLMEYKSRTYFWMRSRTVVTFLSKSSKRGTGAATVNRSRQSNGNFRGAAVTVCMSVTHGGGC
jgi:hypothetical protein